MTVFADLVPLALFLVLGAVVLVAPFVAVALTTPVAARWRARWEDGTTDLLRVKRRRFPWPSRNVTFGATVYEGGPVGMNAATLRHEAVHVRQYRTRGWWWVWTHPGDREAEARASELTHSGPTLARLD